MAAMNLDRLIGFLNEHGERDDDFDTELTADQHDVALRDLGFDSLGLFNTTIRISEEYGVALQYDEVTEAKTLAEMLTVVNTALATAPSN